MAGWCGAPVRAEDGGRDGRRDHHRERIGGLIRRRGLDLHADQLEPLIREVMSDYDRCDLYAIRACHIEDQLRGAHEELQGLDDLALQEADAPQVMALENRLRQGQIELTQAELGLAMVEWRLKRLREGNTRAV
ncbi:MAG TPA: hypothetical protein VK053_10370 [Jiangellaceae bacterium]|nr:hypothetical protein [Jiangellaceae bacterium]